MQIIKYVNYNDSTLALDGASEMWFTCLRVVCLWLTEILRISLIETETESSKEFKGDINISVVVIENICYGDWGSKWNSIE